MEAIECRERPASDPEQRVVSLSKHEDDWELGDREQTSAVSEVAGDLQRICWIPGGRISTVQKQSKTNDAVPEVSFEKIVAGEQEDDVHDQVHDQENGLNSERDRAKAC
jgi:hypothetical protein